MIHQTKSAEDSAARDSSHSIGAKKVLIIGNELEGAAPRHILRKSSRQREPFDEFVVT